jgi:hypothetical protein
MDKASIAGSEVWRRSVVQGIRSTQGVIFFGSENSYGSEHVAKELTLASDQAKPILPVRLDDSQPAGEFEYLLAGIHWVRYAPQSHEASILEIVQGLGASEAGNPPEAVNFVGTRALQRTRASGLRIFSRAAWAGVLALLAGGTVFLLWLPTSSPRSEPGDTNPQQGAQAAAQPRTNNSVAVSSAPTQSPPVQVWVTNIWTPPPAAPATPTTITQVVIYRPPPEPQTQLSNPAPSSPVGVLVTNGGPRQTASGETAVSSGKATNPLPKGPGPAFPLDGVRVERADPNHATPKR